MFNIEKWKAKWTANAEKSERNQLMDSGWSGAVAKDCSYMTNCLLWELMRELAATKTTPADMFDRPELVAFQEAARHACKED